MNAPLSGLKILDFSTLLPGPYATQILADLGSDVIRIESPNRIDPMHMLPPFVEGISAAYAAINRNKRSLTLDLSKKEAMVVIEKLISSYDIVIEQFRPGVMEKLGYGYNKLKELCPNLIYCSISGYGQTGPKRNDAGHDINYMAVSGMASYGGKKVTGPTLSGMQISDIAGGSHHAVMSILSAVIHRMQTGEGQYIDISMADATLAMTTIYGASVSAGGVEPELETEILNGGIIYDYYQTADGKYLSVGGLEPKFMSKMFMLMGLDEWIVRLGSFDSDNQKAIKKCLKDAFLENTSEYWLKLFSGQDVCVELVLSLKEALNSELFQERGMLVDVPSATGGKISQVGSAMKFSKTSPRYDVIGPKLGQHSDSILAELGFTESQRNDLYREEVSSKL